MPASPTPLKVLWPVILIAGFLLPGSGHFLYGERRRGLLIGAAVLLTFALGLLIGGVRVVEMPDLSTPASSQAPNMMGKVLSQPAFVAQACTGPVAIASGYLARSLASDVNTADLISHSRVFDLGVLYTAIAGALNLLAMIDSTGRSASGQPPRDRAEAEPASDAVSSPTPEAKTETWR